MTSRPIPQTAAKIPQPWVRWMEPRALGKEEAMEVKISRDIPLPTPRSVICSPIHMMTVVPAHRVTIISRMRCV